MKNASAATLSILAAGEFVVAELYQIVPKLGTSTYYFTNCDIPLSAAIYPSSTLNTYLTGLVIQREDLRQKVGVDATDMQLTVSPQWDSPGGPPTIGGYSFLQACRLGILDSAQVTMSKLYMLPPAPGAQIDTSPKAVQWFQGVVGSIEVGRLSAKITASSNLSLMGVQMPRSLFQVGCAHQVYDPGCTLSAATFTVAGTVGSTVFSGANFQTNLTAADNYYDLGVITFTSGVLNHIAASIKTFKHTNGIIQLFTPLPSTPSTGDTFNIYPGCDHQLSTCISKFSNKMHFKGEPFIPVPETMIDGGTSNPPVQAPGYQAGQIIGNAIAATT